MAEIVSQPDIFEWMAERRRCSSRHGPLADTKHPSLPNRLRPLQCDELVLQERSSIAFLRVASRGIPYREEWPFAIHLLGERSERREVFVEVDAPRDEGERTGARRRLEDRTVPLDSGLCRGL
nr:PREDICTED: uncharacterized protein LOC108952423 isoform X1 [Musa acuminata subsp. malaccensis]